MYSFQNPNCRNAMQQKLFMHDLAYRTWISFYCHAEHLQVRCVRSFFQSQSLGDKFFKSRITQILFLFKSNVILTLFNLPLQGKIVFMKKNFLVSNCWSLYRLWKQNSKKEFKMRSSCPKVLSTNHKTVFEFGPVL